MVGALARMMLNGHKLYGEAKKAMEKLGLNPPPQNALYNNLTQAVELVYAVERSLALRNKAWPFPS